MPLVSLGIRDYINDEIIENIALKIGGNVPMETNIEWVNDLWKLFCDEIEKFHILDNEVEIVEVEVNDG